MNSRQAQEVLIRYRPGVDDGNEPELREALGLVQSDPALRDWFERQGAAHAVIRGKLRAIVPPPGLKEQILAERNLVRLPRLNRRVVPWAAAASIVLAGVLILWPKAADTNGFPAFRDRMARSSLRDYRMDVLTKNLGTIREFLNRHQAGGDFVLKQNLASLPPIGCALRSWHGQPAAMVCFDRGRGDVFFLYIIQRAVVTGAPPTESPEFVPVNKLMTASWSLGDKTYVLAGQGNRESLRRYVE